MGYYIHNDKWKPNKQQSHNQSSHPFKMKANIFKEFMVAVSLEEKH